MPIPRTLDDKVAYGYTGKLPLRGRFMFNKILPLSLTFTNTRAKINTPDGDAPSFNIRTTSLKSSLRIFYRLILLRL